MKHYLCGTLSFLWVVMQFCNLFNRSRQLFSIPGSVMAKGFSAWVFPAGGIDPLGAFGVKNESDCLPGQSKSPGNFAGAMLFAQFNNQFVSFFPSSFPRNELVNSHQSFICFLGLNDQVGSDAGEYDLCLNHGANSPVILGLPWHVGKFNCMDDAKARSAGDRFDDLAMRVSHADVNAELWNMHASLTVEKSGEPNVKALIIPSSEKIGFHVSRISKACSVLLNVAVPRNLARALVGAMVSQNPDVSSIYEHSERRAA